MDAGVRSELENSPELLEIIRPQLEAAWEIVRQWPLGKDMHVMSCLVVLKVIAITSSQLKEIGVYTNVTGDTSGRPDDGGFL